jgi:hypothetical protein
VDIEELDRDNPARFEKKSAGIGVEIALAAELSVKLEDRLATGLGSLLGQVPIEALAGWKHRDAAPAGVIDLAVS